jgi:hypothetical protein
MPSRIRFALKIHPLFGAVAYRRCLLLSFRVHTPKGRGMKTVISSAILALFIPAFSFAAADKARSCIVKATEALPKIAGLQVKKSGTRSKPAAPTARKLERAIEADHG